MAKDELFKFQIPLATNGKELVLVYNKDKSIVRHIALTPSLKNVFDMYGPKIFLFAIVHDKGVRVRNMDVIGDPGW